MKGKKGSTDEGGVRSPLVVQWKGKLPPGEHIPQIASSIDLLPTLADLAGVPVKTKKPVDGLSLKPLLTDSKTKWPPRIVYNYWQGATSLRTQKYRLDKDDRLYDMETDRGQNLDLSKQMPQLTDSLKNLKVVWLNDVKPQSSTQVHRPFPLGDPDFEYTQLPARDGLPHGNIERSNRWPNCSFFTNWKHLADRITWDVDVLAVGDFEVDLYYTAKKTDLGASFELRLGNERLEGEVTEAHDPPLVGKERDRDPRQESYTKDFVAMHLGKIHLEKGRGSLTLKALKIPGEGVMDVRLLTFKRIK
ncbi:sulfatase-like hydrolase/transferase [Flavobacteriaceae bacterium F89]|uniref:Sulfatase-like hydrolase/transferase n=1 Tax=Cerina litoralis TaxID=2874477 RepID=A0AAE3F087_9FLAO|nr:sulfatase/phosphatase domain-containing protein [Cerina litoralis]MCG2462922.1 sulfatase-like hydrolase/transferase [Cerina litoralis]